MTKREFSAEYKAKIVIEVLDGEKQASEIAAREEISPKLLSNWKKEFLENSYRVFSVTKDERKAKNELKTIQEREQDLMAKVGRLTIENDWLKKNLNKCLDTSQAKNLISKDDKLPINRQCELVNVNRSSFYYEPKLPTDVAMAFEESVRQRLDFWHTKFCYLGARRLAAKLRNEDGISVGRKLVKRLMGEMGIYAVYPKPNLSKRSKQHNIFPYLLKNMPIFMPNQVWAIDITYIKMGRTHMYLTAIIDWYSRFIVGFALSDTLETTPVLQAVRQAVDTYGVPAIINSDQGSQFTSDDYISFLKEEKIRQSMDGKARWVDNVIIERWFRSLKCDDIYINEYQTPRELRKGIAVYIKEYNYERPHQSFNYQYPAQIYGAGFAA